MGKEEVSDEKYREFFVKLKRNHTVSTRSFYVLAVGITAMVIPDFLVRKGTIEKPDSLLELLMTLGALVIILVGVVIQWRNRNPLNTRCPKCNATYGNMIYKTKHDGYTGYPDRHHYQHPP